MALVGDGDRADAVDTPKQAAKPSLLHTVVDRVGWHAGVEQLRPRDRAVLADGQSVDRGVRGLATRRLCCQGRAT
jgi:hypothetical protein